ncbi:MAG: hypothetical protein V2I33_22475 [Kangiellaceae bacterium]|jgi:hypothetical protein|nr:hypothetical protein [Kangiellaceae bacterium]
MTQHQVRIAALEQENKELEQVRSDTQAKLAQTDDRLSSALKDKLEADLKCNTALSEKARLQAELDLATKQADSLPNLHTL